MLSIITTAVLLLAPFVIYLLKWLDAKNKYWEKLKVKHVKPKLFFGNTFEAVIGSKHPAEVIEKTYIKFPNEDIIGYYETVKPMLIVRSPQLIENILIKDFSYFTDRSVSPGPSKISIATNLFNMCGKEWRAFRTKLSPLFTTQKLKYMFGPLSECGKNLSSVLDSNLDKEVDVKEIMSLFSIDVIGSCAFGIDPRVLQNPSSNFRGMAKNMFDFDVTQYLRILFIGVAPKIANRLNITFIKYHIMKYFCDIIANTMQFRQKHGVERHDFVQMLMQLKETGKIEMHVHDPDDEFLNEANNKNNDSYEIKVTDELLVGTGFGFLVAGFHTTASTLTYALFELAQQPDILYKVKREIKDQVAVHGNITYDSLKCMTYLDKVLKETMRLHPSAPTIVRVCTKTYKFPSGLTVQPGDSIIIPVLALHRDPFIYEDPYTFNPNRFDTPPRVGTFLPFGEGPRMCIAARFAVLEMKYALSKMLMNYDIQLSRRTKIPLKMSPRLFLNTPKEEVLIRITKA